MKPSVAADIIKAPRNVNAPASYELPERDQPVKEADMSDSNIPEGYCQCGCGEKTIMAKWDDKRRNHVKGKPLRFINGHNGRGLGISSNLKDAYKINKITGCWEWQRSRITGGYGTLSVDGKQVYSHRHFYETFVGHIPDGMDIDHLCRNRACCNPYHLEPVTRLVNLRRGEGTKLTDDEVVEIKLWAQVNDVWQKDIAKAYGVTHDHVCRIVNGRQRQNALVTLRGKL